MTDMMPDRSPTIASAAAKLRDPGNRRRLTFERDDEAEREAPRVEAPAPAEAGPRAEAPAPAGAAPRADGGFDWHAPPGPDKFAMFLEAFPPKMT